MRTFRVRLKLDDDLAAWFEKFPDKSAVLQTALREYAERNSKASDETLREIAMAIRGLCLEVGRLAACLGSEVSGVVVNGKTKSAVNPRVDALLENVLKVGDGLNAQR